MGEAWIISVEAYQIGTNPNACSEDQDGKFSDYTLEAQCP